MSVSVIMSDGAGSSLAGPLTPEERLKLQQFAHGKNGPAAMPPTTWQQPPPEKPGAAFVEDLRRSAGGVPTLDPDLAVLTKYGIDPQELLGGPVDYDPTRFENDLPTTTRAFEPYEQADGERIALDAGVEETVPNSAFRPPAIAATRQMDKFDDEVYYAHEALRDDAKRKRYFDIASKETTTSIMRAVEDKKLTTAEALAILNVRARIQAEERDIRAEGMQYEGQVRKSPRDIRDEALWRIFDAETMDYSPFKQ